MMFYLFVCFYHYGLMVSYFIQWPIINFIIIYFHAVLASNLASEVLQATFYVPWPCPHHSSSTSLSSGLSGSSCTFFALARE